jgi:LacI family transcriptional regulator
MGYSVDIIVPVQGTARLYQCMLSDGNWQSPIAGLFGRGDVASALCVAAMLCSRRVKSARVLIVLDTASAWSRGILKGFASVAHECGWTLLHYHPTASLDWLIREWKPSAAVVPPGHLETNAFTDLGVARVAVNCDRTSDGFASVFPDERAIADAAALHLHTRGLRNLTAFRFSNDPFAVLREQHFYEKAANLNARAVPGWWLDEANPPRTQENPAALVSWLKALPKPCGVFAGCDSWARVVARYCKISGIRIPDEVALIGVDNDSIECELQSPPLSSVAVPWRTLGQQAANLVQLALAGKSIARRRVIVPPLDVMARRSTEVFAIEDPLVAKAVGWISDNAARRVTVPAVARATATSRQRLERRFRAVLGRTIMQEVRRARVDIAKQLLATTSLELPRIAKLSGFSSHALFSVAFSRELGQSPSSYRRTLQRLDRDDD